MRTSTGARPGRPSTRLVSSTPLLAPASLALGAALLCALGILPARADVITVDPGSGTASDLLWTPPRATSVTLPPIPAGFFGPGSDAFPGGTVPLMGLPLQGTPPLGPFLGYGIPGQADTIVLRMAPAAVVCGGPPVTIPIEILALSLVSSSPITVTFAGGGSPTPYEVVVSLSKTGVQSAGSMTIRHTTQDGGTFTSILPVRARLEFNKGAPGGPGLPSVTIDPVIETLTNVGPVNPAWQHTTLGLAVMSSPGGVVDHDVNPATAPTAYPTTTNFFVGIVGGGDCAGPGTLPPKKQLTGEAAMLAAHGIFPPQRPPGPSTGGPSHTGFGDGSMGNCPCGNNSPPGSGRGCQNSQGSGALLFSNGAPSIAVDSVADDDAVTLRAIDMTKPPPVCVFFQGSNLLGAPFLSGDGLRFIGGQIIRLGTKQGVNGKASYGCLLGDVPISTRGLVVPGDTRFYQAVYRDGANFCTPDTFNWTNVVAITWEP